MPTSLRTLFLTQWFDPEPGAIRGLPLARWLTQHGHDVEVLTGFPNYPGGVVYPGYKLRPWAREVTDDVRVLRVALYPSHDGRSLHRALNYLSFAASAATAGTILTQRADVGFVYHPPPTVGFPALVQRLLRGVPFVYHIADMWPEAAVESGMLGHGRLRRVAEWTIRRWCHQIYARAAAITVLSPGFKSLLVEQGVPEDKIHIIYNWCDEALFAPRAADDSLRQELGLAGRFNVVFAGGMGIFQGLETVLEAASLLRNETEIQFVFVGSGQQEDALKRSAAVRGLENVLFLGRQPLEAMPAINALADVLLVHLKDVPIFSSTIPSKTQVSMASGRPILMAVKGDAGNLVRDAGAGLVIPPEHPVEMAQAVRKLHAMCRPEREQLGNAGRAFYEQNMSLAVGARQTDEVLRSVARRRPGQTV